MGFHCIPVLAHRSSPNLQLERNKLTLTKYCLPILYYNKLFYSLVIKEILKRKNVTCIESGFMLFCAEHFAHK